MPRWHLSQTNHEFIAREVEPFLPDRIFDTHFYLFAHRHFVDLSAGYRDMPPCLNLASYYDFVD